MDEQSAETVTALLQATGRGDAEAKARLWSTVYEELRGIARGAMQREPAGHTLQPTAVVHEVYLRLLGGEQLPPRNRAYFFGAAAQAMRRILIEHARKHTPAKGRGGTASFVLENLTVHASADSLEDFQAVDEALDALHTIIKK